jgi:hypothetical protein
MLPKPFDQRRKLDTVRHTMPCSVDVAVPEGISSFELGLCLVATLTKLYGAVVTDVTYTTDGHPTYSVRLNTTTSQRAGDIAQSGG